ETRRAADNAAISKATLTGVVKTLESRGLIARRVSDTDRRLVNLELTPSGVALMKELYPAFNAAEAEIVSRLSPSSRRSQRAQRNTQAEARRSPHRVCALSLSKGARSQSTSGLRQAQPAFMTTHFARLRAHRGSAHVRSLRG